MSNPSLSHDIIIVGGGIAGLTAGVTAARLGMRTLVLSGEVLGGQLLSIERVDGFPGHPEGIPGFDLCPATEEQAAQAGAEVVAAVATALQLTADGWTVTTQDADYRAGAVVLATGTRLRTLGVPGEARLTGKGVSHCASCDAPLLRGKPVAVIGGGDSALQEALTLAPVASKVTILTHGPALTAQAAYRAQIAQRHNVEVRTGIKVLEILGEHGVSGVSILDAGADETIPAAAAFVFVGLTPDSALVPAEVCNAAGFVQVDAGMRTTLPGLYAAGTVRAGTIFRASASAGDGATAALAAWSDFCCTASDA